MRKILILIAIPLVAHDLYFLPASFRVKAGDSIRVAFHNGDAFPESEAAAPIARLRDTNLLSASGAAPLNNLRASGKEVLADVTAPGSGDLLLTARTVPNFISMEPDKFEEYLKEEGLAHVLRWRAEHGESKQKSRERYSKYVKSLLLAGAPSGYFDHKVGLTLEIVPEANPSLVKPGASLPIRVLFRGQPAAGLQVETAFAAATGKTQVAVVGRTNADGRIVLPVAQSGRWRIHTLLMERCADPKAADWESFWASFTFEN